MLNKPGKQPKTHYRLKFKFKGTSLKDEIQYNKLCLTTASGPICSCRFNESKKSPSVASPVAKHSISGLKGGSGVEELVPEKPFPDKPFQHGFKNRWDWLWRLPADPGLASYKDRQRAATRCTSRSLGWANPPQLHCCLH